MTYDEFVTIYMCTDKQCIDCKCTECEKIIREDMESFITIMNDEAEVYAWLKDQMYEKGMTIKEFAEKAGLKHSTVVNYMGNSYHCSPSVFKIMALADVLGYKLGWIRKC